MKPQKHKAQVKTARSLALDILDDVFGKGKTIDESAATRSYEMGISLADKAFAYLLASEVIRRKSSVDALLASYLTKPLKPSQQRVYHALMVGVVQLCILDTPPHAAVHETVQAIADSSYAPLKGLVNAVLQNITRSLNDAKQKLQSSPAALPGDTQGRWKKYYGDAFCVQAGAMITQKPALDIAVKTDPEVWAKKLKGEVLAGNIIRVSHDVKVEELPGYKDGSWWVQDVGASLPALALGNVKGKHVLDLCAAPGGKTAQLMALGAKVTAVDSSEKRMERFRQNMQRLGYAPEILIEDIRTWRPKNPVDAVLLDAPCSATGTLRKHPEVLWIRKAEDVNKLAVLQRECLDGVLAWLPPGVPLVYTVCSMEPEEGEEQAAAALKRHSGLAMDRISLDETKFSGAIKADGAVRLLPTHFAAQGGNDGFYAARLIKR